MKKSDDYQAKIKMWAEHLNVVPVPALPKLPKFSGQKFRSHREMNAWKKQLLMQLAQEATD